MAKKMRRLLALVIAMALCAGQIAVPAIAVEEETQKVTVSAELAGYSQIPEESETMTVVTEEPVEDTLRDPEAGEILESTSTTTNWSGTTEEGAELSGSETLTEYTITDDYIGSKLEEGGSLNGAQTETTITTETNTETESMVTEEITTAKTEESLLEENIGTYTEETTDTQEGEWISGSEVTEGEFVETSVQREEETDTVILGQGEIPEEGITIELKPNTGDKNSFSGEATGEMVILEENMEIPENASLVYDEDGNLIGYNLTTEGDAVITDTTEVNGEAKQEEVQLDPEGVTAAVTPDLETAAEKLDIPINENSEITKEYDPEDAQKVSAYIVTNTTRENGTLEAIDQMVKPASGTSVLEDGSTETVTTEDITDEDGNVIGFISRSVITDTDGRVIKDTTTTQTAVKNDPPAAAESVVTFTLPEKPVQSTTTDENGEITTVTVAEILDDSGNVIGYEAVTVITDAAGTELFRGSEKLYGTTQTVTESVEAGEAAASGSYTYVKTIVDTYRVTAEETIYKDMTTYDRLTSIINEMTITDTYEIVEVDGTLYYIYTGSMNVTEGENHGDTSLMQPVTPDKDLMVKNENLDLDQGGDTIKGQNGTPREGFKFVGYGIDTSLNINKGGSGSDVVQFRLKSADGKEYYAMCIDFDTYIQEGHLYAIEDITSENYYQQSGSLDVSSAEKIRSVALNGYWGTESDVGSLEDVKAFLSAYLTGTKNMDADTAAGIVNSLTPGQAQAATQAALWKFGNKSSVSGVNERDLVAGSSKTDETMTKYLYDALLAAANDADAELEANEGVEFLDAEDVTAGAITINSKVEPTEANDYAENVYNTDLSFTLGIEPSKLNGDLIVTVNAGGKEVKKVRLAGADDPLLPLGRIVKNEDGSYTIPDVEIAEGVTINLNLSGTQDLGTGVYIYTSLEGSYTDSQTLVTLATGSRKVNLDMNMRFEVEAPTASITQKTETQYGTRTDERTDTRTDVTVRTETTTSAEHKRTAEITGEGTKEYTAEVTVKQVIVQEEKEEREWFASWSKEYDPEFVPENDDVPIGDEDEEIQEADGLLQIFDEEVPLARAPKTGDISLLWAAISLCSLSGLVMLNKKREEV